MISSFVTSFIYLKANIIWCRKHKKPLKRSRESDAWAVLTSFPTTAATAWFFLKVSTKEGRSVLFRSSSCRAAARTTNWHPVSHPGVHAEAGAVPAEHLSGPVSAAAPQEGPHSAQVHRGRNVRAVTNESLIQIRKEISVWHAGTLHRRKNRGNPKKESWWLSCFQPLFLIWLCTVAPASSLGMCRAHRQKYPEALLSK